MIVYGNMKMLVYGYKRYSEYTPEGTLDLIEWRQGDEPDEPVEKIPAHSCDFSRELAGQLLINIFIIYMANPHKYINLTVCMERFRIMCFPFGFLFLWAFYSISRCGRVPTPFVVCGSQNPGPAPHDHTGSAVWNCQFSSVFLFRLMS